MPYLRLTITDTLGFWDDYLENYLINPENSKTITIWYKLPDDWWAGDSLKSDRIEALLCHLYGQHWRLGNGDGSQYVVLKQQEHRLTDEEVQARIWAEKKESCYTVSTDGAITLIDPAAM